MALEIIAEDGGKDRQHRDSLGKLLAATTGSICIASPYITDNELISRLEKHKRGVRILTSLSKMDVVTHSTSLDCLSSLIQAGVECRSVSDVRLHAKVYLFADNCAVVTSANLTNSAMSTNVEVGVCVTNGGVQKLALWFDTLWKNAKRIKLNEVIRLREETNELRRQFQALRKKARDRPKRVVETNPNVRSARDLRELLQERHAFFVCNTNRRWSPDRRDEHSMRHMRFAAVWSEFRWEKHIGRVKNGDAILMFAKGVGIVGIAQAKGGVEILQPGKPGRIRTDRDSQTEWRIPVEDWLV